MVLQLTSIEPSWDEHCSELAVRQVDLVTGRNIWQELGGCPRSAREAAALYRRIGVTSLREAVGVILGPEISPLMAHRGDIVMARNALGVCRGELAEFMDQMLPMKEVVCAWRVTNG